MLGGILSVCDDATLMGGMGGSDLMIAPFDLVSRIESRMPGLRTLAFGRSYCSGNGFGGGETKLSGMACWECARKDRDVNQT